MNLREKVIMYRDVRTSDGAGGFTTIRTKVGDLYADIKPMSSVSIGSLGLDFNQIQGIQVYEVWIRTDINRTPNTTYSMDWESIYGTLILVVNVVEVRLQFTKLICRHENRVTD